MKGEGRGVHPPETSKEAKRGLSVAGGSGRESSKERAKERLSALVLGRWTSRLAGSFFMKGSRVFAWYSGSAGSSPGLPGLASADLGGGWMWRDTAYVAPSIIPNFLSRNVVDRLAANNAPPRTTASSASRCLRPTPRGAGNAANKYGGKFGIELLS